jgi:hypothetical protein
MTETQAKQALDAWTIKTYLDWFNNYGTIEKMAGDYNLSPSGMKAIIEKGKELYEG